MVQLEEVEDAELDRAQPGPVGDDYDSDDFVDTGTSTLFPPTTAPQTPPPSKTTTPLTSPPQTHQTPNSQTTTSHPISPPKPSQTGAPPLPPSPLNPHYN